MPVPSVRTDLDAVANNNSPAGSESAKGTVDDYLRAHAAFIKQNYDDIQLKAPIANPAFTGTPTGITAAHVGAVALTGNETVAGVKTFSSSPVVPTPTTDMQASTKKYVDDSVVTVADASESAKGIIEIATSAETAALTDTERAVTPAGLGDLFDSSLDTSGYYKLPGGMIIQWGRVQQVQGAVSFGLEFPTACLSVLLTKGRLTARNAQSAAATASIFTTTGFTLDPNDSGAWPEYFVSWFAVGH